MNKKTTAKFSAVNKGAARYAMLLDCLSAHYPGMVSLADIVRITGLPKATAFRLMKALQEEQLVAYDSIHEAYYLGAKLMDLGLRALSQNFALLARPSLERIAEATDDTVFAGIPENDHMRCLVRVTGNYPVRILSLEEGDAWPLGVGSIGQALLAAYDDAYIDAYLQRYLPFMSKFAPVTAEQVKEQVQQTRKRGYAFSCGDLLEGMSAVGVAIMAPGLRRPWGALSVAAVTPRLADERREKVVALLKREADLIGQTMQDRLSSLKGRE